VVATSLALVHVSDVIVPSCNCCIKSATILVYNTIY
jgi:hypothetical protein